MFLSASHRPNGDDEMCNFYIMYYTLNNVRRLAYDRCWSKPPNDMHFPAKLPPLPSYATPPPDHVGGEQGETRIPNSGSDANSSTGSDSSMGPDSGNRPYSDSGTGADSSTGSNSDSSTGFDSNSGTLPAPSVSVLPVIPPRSGPGLVLSEDWPLNGIAIPEIALGQVTAAAIDAAGDLHILHRGHVTWDYE